MAKLIGIAFKTEKGGPMISASQAEVTQAKGVEDDVYGRPGKRQVTLMSLQQWQLACNDIGKALPWLTRRANLLIDGLSFSQQDLGKRLAIGELVLEVTGETDPCNKMELACPALEKALQPDWRGGVTCRVIHGSHIQLNASVSFLTLFKS